MPNRSVLYPDLGRPTERKAGCFLKTPRNALPIPLAGVGGSGQVGSDTATRLTSGKVMGKTTSPPKTLTLVNPNPVPMEITSIIPPTIAFAEQGSTCGNFFAST